MLPDYFGKHSTKFTFRGYSGGMSTLLRTSWEPEEQLLSVLVHFFEHGRWGSLVETAVEGQSLTPEDQLFILIECKPSLNPSIKSGEKIFTRSGTRL
jgi:hypothetical protein